MLILIFYGVIVVLGAGVAARYFLQWRKSQYEIDNKEFLIAGAILTVLAVPLITWAGYEISIKNQVTYVENWNGWEVDAVKVVSQCYRDGPNRHEYDCDPYYVDVPYDCSYYTGSGKDRRRVSKTCYRKEKRYHQCPYTSEEWTFLVKTTIGEWQIADRNLPTNPDEYRWRSYKPVPQSWWNDPYHTGVPERWQQVRDRLDAGKPDPVTKRMEYDNYILASHNTIMRQYSHDVDRYVKAGQMPAFSTGVYDLYQLDRVYFVGPAASGFSAAQKADWQRRIRAFNGALGQSLQGDLHLVIVDANQITNPDNYQLSLLSYWVSPAFAKEGFAKNGILVIVGTKDGKTVDWARASTGMPMGNEAMLLQVQSDLKGLPLESEALLGNPTATVSGGRLVTVNIGSSAIEKIVWGPNRFKRVRMKAHGPDSPGFEYLLKELEPTASQKGWIIFVSFLAGCVAWGICIVAGVPRYRGRFR